MKIKVTEQGAIVPKELLEGVEEVEIYQESDRLVLIPTFTEDPILEFGKNPVSLNDSITDASVNLDKYVYGSPHGT